MRHAYARLVAALVRRVGAQHVEVVEDSVQSALVKALETWALRSDHQPPENPAGWLYRVALNHAREALRTATRRDRLTQQWETELPPQDPSGGRDDVLRMLFLCCHDALPVDNQLVLALKVVCGFDVREIAERLFSSEAHVYKRLSRARTGLRQAVGESFTDQEHLDPKQYLGRLPAVQRVLYVLFTEGHQSLHASHGMRVELCDEAMRLAEMLADHPIGNDPTGAALVSLMHLHRARMGARQDPTGGLLLLAEQDRATWSVALIQSGLDWLARSAQGDVFSRYHAEAGIAAEHCLASSLAATRWDRIAACYAMLESAEASPLHTLNRAVAVAEWKGASAGLEILEGLEPPGWLAGSYQWAVVLADLHRRAGNSALAAAHKRAALKLAPSEAVKTLLTRRLRWSPEE